MSVIIPVYKDAVGLRDTLRSLSNQTIPQSKYEIIVANDGADDAITQVCNAFAVREVRIYPNRGSYFARNRALEESSGEYIAFVDADIIVPSQWLEKGRDVLKHADYVGGRVRIDTQRITNPAHYYESITAFRDKGSGENDNHFFVTANLFIKREIAESLGGFDERLRSGGDNEFGMRVYTSSRYVQEFRRELEVLHPPRGFRGLVSKRVRIFEGKKMLNKLYPETYNFTLSSPMHFVSQLLIPPKFRSVKKLYDPNQSFSFMRFYFFIWRYKSSVSWNVLRLLWKKSH